MADKMTKTTSSISLDNKTENMPPKTTTPNSRGAAATANTQIVTRLADNITESYRKLKEKEQQLNDLTNQQHYNNNKQNLKRTNTESSNNAKLLKPILKTPTDEWQEVCSPKNKLKRKKTLSASLTSVTDSVNQEKRTRIEGMQLNCRGRLHIKENINSPSTPSANNPASPSATKMEKLAGKPPLPPSHNKVATQTESKVLVNPPPRLKRKLQENVQTIQKLNALTEQLRLEINELKSSLTTEKGAVRVLRAQNESEARKWKNEVKKLQNAIELLKKAGANTKKCDTTSTNNNENLPQAAMGGLVNYEIQRLTNEINALKEANKALEEKKVINCDADRRKAADIRELKDSYEIRLTQIQKSAKNEISRLLEEIKTKERNIGQLKKDLQILQNSKTITTISRNATTNNINTNLTNTNNNKTTNSNAKINQNNKKPKSSLTNAATNNKQLQQNEESSKEKESSKDKESAAATGMKNKDLNKKGDNSNEISKLKNIELTINNTKNVTTNLQKSTKILNTHHNNTTIHNSTEKQPEIIENNNSSNTITIIHKHLKSLDLPELDAHHNDDGHQCCLNLLHKKPMLLTTATQTLNEKMFATATTQTLSVASTDAAVMTSPQLACDEIDHFDEQHITQELTQHLQNKAIQDAKDEHDHHHLHDRHHHHHHHHHNHHNSDSDSALSSAPTSISPQPPANGEEPTDIWQTMRSYTHDIEKLQKEVDLLQKQNEELKQELNMAKDQIIELETNAMESANNSKIPQLMERIKYLEDQEHQLEAEANDLREQNELLEFRILELEESNDRWSLQSHSNPTSESSSESMQTTTVANNNTQNLWSCPGANNTNKPDPFEMLFGSNSHSSQNTSIQLDSGIISPQSQHHHDDLIDISNEELCRRLGELLKKSTLEEDERHCLQQVLNLVQQLDALTPRSGPNSLNATSSSDEASSLDLVKSRISDYSSASSASTSSARSTYDNISSVSSTKVNNSNSSNSSTTPSRIVATVQPYNSHQLAPHNTPTDSPRKTRCQPWQTSSLSESGVFVESDFYSDASDNNVCTQTDFEDSGISNYTAHHIFNSPTKKVPVHQQNSATEQKRLQYYKERVEILESKVQIYESSGDVQAKRLAERLQREILLEKEVNELRDRVEFLESENSTLEEEKCEFEEAENDTRLRLQRLEVELEILSQRNIELEMSREALSAKYKDCHSECLILRDDLATTETQIRHLEEDKQKAKENLEFLHNTLPLFLVCNTYCTLAQVQNQNYQVASVAVSTDSLNQDMGNQGSNINIANSPTRFLAGGIDKDFAKASEICTCHEREIQYLKEEVKCLRHQIKEINTRHYAAMESADSHWVDLEREYKEREEQYRAKEMCLKQKIQKLQDCLREDARSANEKICQLEEAEQDLKTCLVRVSKEHQKLQEDHQLMVAEFERFKEQHEQVREQQKPLTEALENEKKRNKAIIDEISFMRKLQQETESQGKKELESVRGQMFDLKKDFLHIEVTNGELREEVITLELQIQNLEKALQESEEKIRCLTDEIRTKDEICQKLEKRLERSEGYSLADELGDSPSKRFKREDVKDLKTASKGLGQALRHMGDCERMLPTQKQFKTIARDVKKLADTLLQGDATEEEMLQEIETEINERLMVFHTLQKESEFYCTVYYPVKRKCGLEIAQLLKETSTEKSSQAYFDRNNQNLSFCFNKTCPSNSLPTKQQQKNFELNTIMIKCPSIVTNQEHNRTQCCLKCKRLEQPSRNTSTISNVANKNKCVCKKLDITSSSSSSSVASEHFPVKLSLKDDYIEHKMPRAIRKYHSKSNKPATSKIENREEHKPYNSQKCDEYYSCSSDESDDNSSIAKSFCSRKRSNTNRNHVILELLQKVVHLINKDNPVRKEALRITKVNASNLEEKSSKVTTTPSKVKIEPQHNEVIPPTSGQLPLLTWPPPCLCYAYGMASVQDRTHFNVPLLRPYNLAATEGVQIPQPFVYEESESFKDCSSGNKSFDNMPNNLLCICSNICPKHGSIKRELKGTQESFKPKEQKKTEDIDEELYPTFVDKECLRSYDAIKPCRDSLMVYDDEEPQQRKDIKEFDEELQPIFAKQSDFELYEPCQDCLMEYDDEDPSRTDLHKVTDEEIKLENTDYEDLYNPYEPCQDCLWEYDDEEPSRTDLHKTENEEIKLELEEVDEELYPHYVDKTSLASFNPNEPSPDSLVEYDDEEPKKSEKSINLDDELQTGYNEQIAYDPNEPCLDCLREYDDEEPSWPDITTNITPKRDNNQAEISLNQEPDSKITKKSNADPEIKEILQVLEETDRSPYIVENTTNTGNIYNFLPEIDRPTPGDAKQIIRYESEEEYDSNYHEDEIEEEYELAKEIRAENHKKKKRDLNIDPGERMALATIKTLEEGEGSPEEMKFFIDSLIMDLDAMEYARRKSQFEKNICKSKSCARESFPVTITEVTDLGANSLYVKWKIHNCYGIAGYEVYTDGYLTNRYYNCKHEAAVITQVDITLPHKIALVALAYNDNDESIAVICNLKNNKNRTKSLLWKTDEDKKQKSLSALWTPSIYLYDPITCKTATIMRDNF